MNGFFLVCLGLALGAVIAVMGLGLFAMARGGAFNRKYGNRLMRARVTLQASALLLLLIAGLAFDK